MEEDEPKNNWADQTVHGREVFHHVAQETSAYELWTKLETMYQAKASRNNERVVVALLKNQKELTFEA